MTILSRSLDKPLLRAVLCGVLAGGFAACSKTPGATEVANVGPATGTASASAATSAPMPARAADDGIAWTHASSAADVDAAFARAKAQAKPVFVYWGAGWCPPCNQVKATIFNRQDFIERSRAFVPVYVDGDSVGAQKLGARFHVSGYPTMVLFNAQGDEVTRLPGEVDPARYTEVLNLGMGAARPAKTVLADALAGAPIAPNEWRMLAFYAYDTDEQQLVAKDKVPATLARLAESCPKDAPEVATRLRLKALAATEPSAAAVPPARASALDLAALLGDPVRVREAADVLINSPAEIVRAASATGTTERSQTVAAMTSALQRLEADPTLSRADRMQALIGQVDLARIDLPEAAAASAKATPPPLPTLPPALLADVREQAARADREFTDGYERQAVVTAAAYMLDRAGLSKESDALLEANLAKSHSPYYLMSELAGNARRRGDNAAALRWYARAFETSEGPATRSAMGCELCQRPDRPGTRRRAGDRDGDDADLEGSGEPARRLLRAQRPFAEARRHQAAGLECQGRALGADGSLAFSAGHLLRAGPAQRGRSVDVFAVAHAAAPGLSRSGAVPRSLLGAGVAAPLSAVCAAGVPA